MLRSLEIQNFKGIKRGKLDDLAQVNILVGRNNSGKSTVLDALIMMRSAIVSDDYLSARGVDQIIRRHIGASRGNLDYDELWFGRNTAEPISFFATIDADTTDADTTLLEKWVSRGAGFPPEVVAEIQSTSRDSSPYTWGSEANTGSARHYLSSAPWKLIKDQFGEKAATYLGLVHVLDSGDIRQAIAERIWPDLINDRRDIRVTRMLNDIYGTNIEYVSFMPYPRDPRLVAALPHTAVAIDWFGDGLRYALNILALGVVLQGTALLIEELETHQHPESLRKLTQTLFELAKQQELQLFLTTHSMELITYALEVAEEKEVDLKLHHLSLDQEGTLSSTAMSQPNTKVLLDIGHDPRLHYKYIGVE
jgi:hypothetical protein